MNDGDAGIDVSGLEEAFGLGRQRQASAGNLNPDGTPKASAKKKKEEVQLIDMKRSNNISIALSRLRMKDGEIKDAILDPVSNEISAEQVSALLGALPTAEELETLKVCATPKHDACSTASFVPPPLLSLSWFVPVPLSVPLPPPPSAPSSLRLLLPPPPPNPPPPPSAPCAAGLLR